MKDYMMRLRKEAEECGNMNAHIYHNMSLENSTLERELYVQVSAYLRARVSVCVLRLQAHQMRERGRMGYAQHMRMRAHDARARMRLHWNIAQRIAQKMA